MKKSIKLLALLLAVVMLIGIVPFSSSAVSILHSLDFHYNFKPNDWLNFTVSDAMHVKLKSGVIIYDESGKVVQNNQGRAGGSTYLFAFEVQPASGYNFDVSDCYFNGARLPKKEKETFAAGWLYTDAMTISVVVRVNLLTLQDNTGTRNIDNFGVTGYHAAGETLKIGTNYVYDSAGHFDRYETSKGNAVVTNPTVIGNSQITMGDVDSTVTAYYVPHTYIYEVPMRYEDCTTSGIYRKTCTCEGCDNYIERIQPAWGHDYVPEVVKPKANAVGYTLYPCNRCKEFKKDASGKVIRDHYTAPTGKVAGFKCAARAANAEKFSWTKTSGVTGYQIQLSTAAGNAWGKAYATKANTYLFKGLTAGANYKARIRTYIRAADGNNYFGPWVTINSPTAPAGTAVKATGGARNFVAKWTARYVTGYQLQYGLKSNFAGAKTITIKNAKAYQYAVKSLKAKTTYYVRIRTYKTMAGANYYSAWSAICSVKTK